MATIAHADVVEALRILTSYDNAKESLFKAGSGGETRFDKLLYRNLESVATKLETVPPLHMEIAENSQRNLWTNGTGDDVRWKFVVNCLQLLEILMKILPNKLRKENLERSKSDESEIGNRKKVSFGGSHDESWRDDMVGEVNRQTSLDVDKNVNNPASRFDDDATCLSFNKNVPVSQNESKTPGDNTNLQSLKTDENIMLGVGQQKVVMTTIQFVVSLGICPNLQPGVGIPVELRSEFVKSIVTRMETATEREKSRRLFCVLKVFMICVRHSVLSSEILSRHLSDLLCVLLQLGYREGKHKERKSDVTSPESSHKTSSSSSKTSDHYTGSGLSLQEIEHAREELMYITEHVYKPLVVKELLLLQGGPNPRMLKKQLQIPQSVNKLSPLPRSPAWLRRVCGRLLTEVLLGRHGIRHVLLGMLGDDVIADSSAVIDWRKYDAVARVIANCPFQADSLTEYYGNVGSQLVDLLHQPESKAWRHYIRVVSGVVGHMTARNPDLTQSEVMGPILLPFLDAKQERSLDGHTVVKAKTLAQAVEDVYQIFVLGEAKTDEMLSLLEPVVVVIFQLYTYVQQHSVSVAYRSWLAAILTTYIKHRDPEPSLHFLHTCVTLTSGDLGGINSRSTFYCDGTDSVCVVKRKRYDTDREPMNQIEPLMILLTKLNDTSIIADFFISLLKKVQEIILTEVADAEKIHTHISIPESQTQNISILHTVASMCDRFESDCLRKTSHVIDFIQVTLERCVSVHTLTTDSDMTEFENETLHMGLGLLVAVLSNNTQLTGEEKPRLKRLLPLLEKIQSSYRDDDIVDMMTALRIAIATHGFVLADKLFDKSGKQSSALKASDRKDPPKIEIISSSDVGMGNLDLNEKCSVDGISSENMKANREVEYSGSNFENKLDISVDENEMDNKTKYADDTKYANEAKYATDAKYADEVINTDAAKYAHAKYANEYKHADNDKYFTQPKHDTHSNIPTPSDSNIPKTETKKSSKEHTTYTQAINEINDPLIPIKGHGLILLTRLLRSKDGETLQHKPYILSTLLTNLHNDDSYVYLPAINALSALVDCSQGEIITTLVKEFVESATRKSTEVTLKLGEVLVKATRNLGDLVPAHRDILLPAFLHGTRSHDPSIRASSLSNLGEVCCLLRFSLSSHLHEILKCGSELLKGDEDIEVRRAAAMLLTQIIQGAGSDIIQVLGDSIKDIYHLLKFVRTTQTDDVTLLHVNLALDQLNEIMKEIVFPQQKLVKKIQILGTE